MNDLRTIKTEESIKEEYIQLLENMSFEEITVSRIIQDCRINRSTFYRHYKDKYDLADQFNKEMLDQLKKANSSLRVTAEHIDEKTLFPLLRFFRKNQHTFFIISKRHMPYDLFDQMLDITADHIKKEIAHPHLDQRYVSFFSRLIASNILETVKWWHTDWPEKSDEEVIHIIKETIEKGIYPSFHTLTDK